MIIRDRERSISFITEITNGATGVESVWNKIDRCEIPGIYDVEFVSVSLGDRVIKSITVYLIESPFRSHDENKVQRLEALQFYGQLFNRIHIGDVFAPSGCPLRIDPSFKSSDSESIFRLDPQFRGRKSDLPICLNNAARCFFPDNVSVSNAVKAIATPGRFAVELDSSKEVGRKIRLYYYDNYKYKDECIRGITVNERGVISREKHYLGIHRDVQEFKEEIEKVTDPAFSKQILRRHIYQEFDMSLYFLAHERSDYGVDAKLYFRNEQIAPERLRPKGLPRNMATI